jgi:LysM repeat protein
MLHGIMRAATAALLFVIAILVYINYFHRSDSVLPEHSEVATAPEVPKVPISLDGIPAAPAFPLAPVADIVAPAPIAMPERAPAPARTRSEISDNGQLAEVVELPPSSRPRAASAPTSATPPASKPAGKRTHIVQPGESLWVISRKYLGNGELNAKLAEANGLSAKDRIKAGQLLIIPDLSGAPGIAQKPIEPARVSEDLADDDDARHFTRISNPVHASQPALMSTTVPNKY